VVFRRVLVGAIRDEDLREAEKQLELAARSEHCPAVEELANYAVWPQYDPVLPLQLCDERRAEIRSHLEHGCAACCKQVEIAERRRKSRNADVA
jgi:hypothetical protein